MTSLDDTDRMIISVLRGQGPMRFTEIVQSLKGRVAASPPKISRKLKHLVELGMVKREVLNRWPPNARYSVSQKDETTEGTDGDLGLSSGRRAPEKARGSRDARLLLALIFTLVVAAGIIQGAYILSVIAGGFILIGYAAYRMARLLERRETRLDVMERRLERIERRLFE